LALPSFDHTRRLRNVNLRNPLWPPGGIRPDLVIHTRA
jgi:hypothetical protein